MCAASSTASSCSFGPMEGAPEVPPAGRLRRSSVLFLFTVQPDEVEATLTPASATASASWAKAPTATPTEGEITAGTEAQEGHGQRVASPYEDQHFKSFAKDLSAKIVDASVEEIMGEAAQTYAWLKAFASQAVVQQVIQAERALHQEGKRHEGQTHAQELSTRTQMQNLSLEPHAQPHQLQHPQQHPQEQAEQQQQQQNQQNQQQQQQQQQKQHGLATTSWRSSACSKAVSGLELPMGELSSSPAACGRIAPAIVPDSSVAVGRLPGAGVEINLLVLPPALDLSETIEYSDLVARYSVGHLSVADIASVSETLPLPSALDVLPTPSSSSSSSSSSASSSASSASSASASSSVGLNGCGFSAASVQAPLFRLQEPWTATACGQRRGSLAIVSTDPATDQHGVDIVHGDVDTLIRFAARASADDYLCCIAGQEDGPDGQSILNIKDLLNSAATRGSSSKRSVGASATADLQEGETSVSETAKRLLKMPQYKLHAMTGGDSVDLVAEFAWLKSFAEPTVVDNVLLKLAGEREGKTKKRKRKRVTERGPL
eukprot:GHVT01087256.1.p1 GENE.GHVT01087256.1~~GHVT01087256.1.p1  ORF type:complete len:547 (+),score=163.23 GHVT01087256.1:390-2030(+)